MAYFFTNLQDLTANTLDGEWTDLSLSALVPVDASIVVIRVRTTNDNGVAYGY
ncbi:hypothetical protein MBAV_004057, partial [Candidatus Magnetobacterium bavaricum]